MNQERTIEFFKQHLAIDRDKLDETLELQPILQQEVHEMALLALAERDYLKEELETTRCEVSASIREDASKRGVKITEAAVAEETRLSEDYDEALQAYLKARRECDKWFALKDAFADRGKFLKELAHLYVAGYWSSNSASTKGAKAKYRDKVIEEVRQARKEYYKSKNVAFENGE